MEHVHKCLEKQQEQQNKFLPLKKTPEENLKAVIQVNHAAEIPFGLKFKDVENDKRKFMRRDSPPGLKTIPLSSEEVEKHYALEPCNGCSFGCKGMKDQVHCPFCSVDKFKPSRKIKVLAHIATAHCQDHRPSVMHKGYKMMICRLKCGSAKRSHYHCYVCHRILTKKALVMAHVSRCCEQQEDVQTSLNFMPKIDDRQLKTPTALLNVKIEEMSAIKRKVKRETPSGLKTIPLCSEEVINHYTLHPCKGCPLGCTGMKDQVHCPICSIYKFKPTRKVKVLAHIVSAHCQDHRPSVTYKENMITICSEHCGQAKRNHYHCCFCDRILTKKAQVLMHVVKCSSDSSEMKPFPMVKSEDRRGKKSLVRGYNASITKPCPQCHKRYHKKYLKCHIQSIHNTSREVKASITAQHHHYSVCIDTHTGLYAVARAIRGPQHPIHVMCRLVSNQQQQQQRVECTLTACQERLQTEWRNDKLDYLCPHLQSVAFSRVNAVPCEVDIQQLTLAPGVSEYLVTQLRHLTLEVENQGTKLLMEVPGLPHASTRMKWFSIFSGTQQFQWWCKFGRTMVIADMKVKRVTCQCKAWNCLHVTVVRWWLGLTLREERKVRPEKPRKVCKTTGGPSEVKAETVHECPSDDDALKRTVEYLCGAKCIEASALMQNKFDRCSLPEVFSPSETECVYCQVALSPLQLVTKHIKILVRGGPPLLGYDSAVRTCPACHMEYRYQEWHHGVYNYDNRLFLSLPFLLMIRSAIITNISISSVAGMLEEEMGSVSAEVVEQAYLSFEAMVVHHYSYSCVRCGYYPSIIVMTSNKAATFNYTETSGDPDQVFGAASKPLVDVDNFWCDVQKDLIAQGVVQEGCQNPIKLAPSPNFWAPYLGPHTRASPLIQNTEAQKTQQDWNATELVSEDVVLQLLAGEKLEMVRHLCCKLGLETAGTKLELLNRIAVVPKVIFDKTYAATFTTSGGWVTAICPHGVTYAAKCLSRLETPGDHVDVLRSFKHLPTVTISEQADVLAEAANQTHSVPLFTPHKGRLVEATENHIKAAQSKSMIVSLPTLIQDRPLNKLCPDLHPITGLAERFCLFDWNHHSPLKSPEDVLRHATLLKELTGYSNSYAARQLDQNKPNSKVYPYCTYSAAHHLFCFRLVTHLHNERINREVAKQFENLSNVTLNDMGQLVKCDVMMVKTGGYTQTVDTDIANGLIFTDLDHLPATVIAGSSDISASVVNVSHHSNGTENVTCKVEHSDVHSEAPAIYLDSQNDVLNAVSHLVHSDIEMLDSSDDTPVIITVG
ncbi:hypothetical protein Pmani_028105 [Petrolisthes manimaculis]|uniref:HMG domain-containing protein n=1 Tax=Petrolisthes manimaculis TaxID=1843537 RepID=A0AAE1TW14_9EUCA|nr:hypothetical protein Pmani_028105 [Petrolisthes manimaculis]